MGTQKNRLNETVLLNSKHMLKITGKKIFTNIHRIFFVYVNLCSKIFNTFLFLFSTKMLVIRAINM